MSSQRWRFLDTGPFQRMGPRFVSVVHLLMQPRSTEEAALAISFVYRVRRQTNRWTRYHRAQTEPYHAFDLPPPPPFPFTPWSEPSIFDLHYVTEVMYKGFASQFLQEYYRGQGLADPW